MNSLQEMSDEELNALAAPKPDITKLSDAELTAMAAPKQGGVYTEASKSPVTVGEDQFTAPKEPLKKPGFMDNVALLESAYAKGSLEFTGRIASAFERVLRLGGKPETVPAAVEYWTDKKKSLLENYDFNPVVKAAAGATELGAEMLTTGPVGKGFQAVSALSKMAPKGLQTLTAGAGGGALLSGMEGLRVGEKGDTAPFSVEQAAEAAKNPVSYMLPMAASAVGNYVNKSKAFGEATETFKDAIPRYTREKGPVKTALHLFYDSLPMLTHMGKAVEHMGSIGPAIQEVVKKISRSPEAMSANDLTTYAAKNLQAGYKKLKAQEDILWERTGFKQQPISTPQEVMSVIDSAKEVIKTSGIPSPAKVIKYLDNELSRGKLTVENVKNMQTTLSNAAADAFSIPGGTGKTIGGEIAAIRDQLFNPIQNSLNSAQLGAFGNAKAHSQGIFKLNDEFNNIVKAGADEAAAVKIADSLVKDSYKYQKAVDGGIISDKGQQAIKARTIAEALESSSNDAGVNINKFIKMANPEYGTSAAKKIMQPSEFEHIEGLSKYLSSINEAKRVGATGRLLAVGTGMGVGAGIGAGAAVGSGNSDWSTAAAIVAYPAMLFASNHPVLKRLLGNSTKNLSPSTMKHINGKIQDIFTRAGYLISDDGVLDKEPRSKQ